MNFKYYALKGVDDVKREQKLQAILLADSFSKTFRPITLERYCLCSNFSSILI